MNYQVPQNIDPNKIFLVNRSETKGRLDPKMALYNKRVQNSLFPMVKLKNLLLSKPQYGANEAGLDRLNNTQPRYIRITDIDENGLISINELGATVAKVEDKYILSNNDILIARSGATVGKAYLHKELPYTCLYAGYLIRFLVDPSKILPGFLFSYTQLNSYREWVSAIQRPSAQPNINAEEYQSLEIPLPDLPTQKAIVEIINQAYLEKQLKEEEANAILKSIDDYLLGELGIELPKTTTQTLQDIFFTVSIRDVRDGRFDPKLYSISVKQLKQSLYMSPFDKHSLNYFIKSNCSGEWGKDESEEVDENKHTKCLVIRATEFDNSYNLRLDNSRVKYRWIENSKLSRMNIQANDLLIEKSGGSEDQPVGRISILTDEVLNGNQIAYSNFIHKITVKGVNPMYLYFYLKTMYNIKITDSMQSQTNGIRNLIMSDYFNQTIVVPPLKMQQEIVEHISEMRARAKKLQAEGAEVLQKAKMEVERMILG